jgi:phenylacetate-CoA ligase
LGAFCLELVDVGEAEQRPCVHAEVLEGAAGSGDIGEHRDRDARRADGTRGETDSIVEDPALAARLRERVVKRLLSANLDFRASRAEDSRAADIQVRLHRAGSGPFASNHVRIKRRYIVGSQPAGSSGSPSGSSP